MKYTFNSFRYYPGGENEGGGTEPTPEDLKAEDEIPAAEIPKEKDFGEKVKDALQDWSNDDQEEQDIDDATP